VAIAVVHHGPPKLWLTMFRIHQIQQPILHGNLEWSCAHFVHFLIAFFICMTECLRIFCKFLFHPVLPLIYILNAARFFSEAR
jgi:hypothetical protein